MIAFPGMLVSAAERAGFKAPPDPDKFEECRDEYPHFFVFCMTQLCRRMAGLDEHWRNAEVIASFSDKEIMQATLEDLIKAGLSFAQ